MVDSKAKGARGELQIRDKLRELTNLGWERTPGSGALGVQHQMKGDLYVPNKENYYCIEVKNYEEDHLNSKILTNKSAVFPEWWAQTIRQAEQTNKHPLLIFKYNRSKFFVAFTWPAVLKYYNSMTIRMNDNVINVALLEDWINYEKPEFING